MSATQTKLTAVLLPADAAGLLEALLPQLQELEAAHDADRGVFEERLALLRSWLVETAAALRKADARGKAPEPATGQTGGKAPLSPDVQRLVDREMQRGDFAPKGKPPCDCPDRARPPSAAKRLLLEKPVVTKDELDRAERGLPTARSLGERLALKLFGKFGIYPDGK